MDGKSLTPQQKKLKQLKEILPEVFAEGKVDWEKLKATLGEDVNFANERYVLNWAGKSEAFKVLQTPTTKTLTPDKKDSINFDETQNIFIEGENLEVLKVLQKSYFGKVKMIYIDPPYNTGNDSFIYPDKFSENRSEYEKRVGDKDEEGYLIKDGMFRKNSKENGQYHSNWLNMMYPRLFLAKNLLRQDGVIFISIGEQEEHNLRLLMNEVFGEENFIGSAGRISKKANNQGDYWAPNFDYVLTYCKQREYCIPFFGGINYKSYSQIEQQGIRKGDKYQLVRLYMTSLDPMRGCNNQRYFIECPDGSFVIPPGDVFPNVVEDGAFISPISGKDKVWRWSYKSYLDKKDKIVIKEVRSSNLVNENGEKTKWNVFTKTYLQDVINNSTASPNNFIESQINQKATHELRELKIPFDFAKPSSLISFLSETCQVESDDIVLDFFAGSGSMAHGIIAKNVDDNKKRKYICAQLAELTDKDSDAHKAGYKTIADIAKERIRRAGRSIVNDKLLIINEKKIKLEKMVNNRLSIINGIWGFENIDQIIDDETSKSLLKEINSLQLTIDNLDIGFKVLKLSNSNFKQWRQINCKNADVLKEQMELFIDPVSKNATTENILYELLLKSGKELNSRLDHKENYYCVNGNELIFMLEKATDEIVDAVIKEKPQKVIALDRLFKGNDQLKTNSSLQMRDAGIEFKTI